MNDVYHVLDDVSFYVGSFFRDDTFVGVIELSIHLERACYGFRIDDFYLLCKTT